MHTFMTLDASKYSITSQKKFPTIHELIMFYQKQEKSYKFALGFPLINETFKNEDENNKTEEEKVFARIQSRNEGPFNLPSFHGTMNRDEANKVLQREAEKTYIVWKTESDDYFVSHKLNHQTKHLRIKNDITHFSVTLAEGNNKISQTSIRRLVDELRTRGVFSNPVRAGSSLSRQASGQHDETSLTGSGAESGLNPNLNGGLQKDIEKVYSKKSDKDNDSAPTRKFTVLGSMNNKDAEKLLLGKPDRSWILRLNSDGELRISAKKPDRVLHIKLYFSLEGVRLKQTDKPGTIDDIIHKLIKRGTLGDQVDQI